MVDNRWFCIPRPVRQPKLRLFCFPYAGGSATTYYPWAAMLSSEVELVAIQPPGRSSRINETAYSDMRQLVDNLIENIVPLLNVPFIFFGHSLGSRVAYELATRLKARQLPTPMQFFASGSRAPHIAGEKKQLYDLPDDAFISELQSLNGTPEEVLQNRELMQLFLPLLRADFQIADTYVSDKTVLNCPITVLAGTEDVGIKPGHLESWKELTSCAGEIHYVPGDHFFIEKNKQLVFHILSEKIESTLTKSAPGMLAGSVASQPKMATNH
ncbi:Putative thioesterase involved in non-ribosomal peptide biosynthesis [Rheinheimera sp. A13L]|uniref:thioesterase II family protein n=1 Tax=Rheinheimera sp. A13L TaxID=506534 RepID=UPI00021248F5|nr:alpha/beta fold hydrolase [Rheinheimera sp. A13L]EGM76589.1 Putative thioesterase involved in non-ribosomal peptide biosynthesis [Rheinheimera sp. A13L]